MLPGAQEISAGVAQPLLLNPRAFAGSVAILVAGLLLLLFFYRRRRYILCWAAGWMVSALSMLVTLVVPRPEFAPFVYGVSQFLGIVSALVFVVSADAYRSRPRFRRGYALGLLPVLIWFTLVPLALKRMDTVFAPGHLLIGGALGAAGIAHIGLLRDLRMLGAFLCGCMLLVTGGTHLWIAYSISTPNAGAMSQVMLLLPVVFIFTALSMQLMTFEDMTYELRVTNRRLESAQGELKQMVTTDPLTGCRNRRYFDEVIGREIQRHRRYRIPLSIMFIDIDHFKAVNDTLGHEAGDGVLKTVAAFLVKHVREADYVFRWGGDEFLILISCREEKALRKGAELREVFALSEEIAALPKGVGLSIGVVEVPQDVTDIVPLIKLADDRMYTDKRRSAS